MKRFLLAAGLLLPMCFSCSAPSALVSSSTVAANTDRHSNTALQPQKRYTPGDFIPTKDENGKWGFQRYGDWAIRPRFDDEGDFGDGLAPVKLGGKWGYVNREGQNVIPYKFEFAGSFADGLARVSMYGKFGFIDKAGQVVIPYKYTTASDFVEGLAQVSFDGRTGFIDKTDKWFDRREDMMQTFSAFARHYVEQDINAWQRKGKYEKMAQWQARVTEANRKARIDSLVAQARAEFIKKEGSKVKIEQQLGSYDTEGEIFLVHDNRFGNLFVPVPIREAEQFEQAFGKVERRDTYRIDGDELAIASALFVTPSGRSYKYSNTADIQYAALDIDYNFEAVTFEEERLQKPSGNQVIASRNMSEGQSDVDMKIPTSGKVNDKTFAVIIANEHYTNVSPVPFANADGKTFKEYCVKTLGLPEKNVRLVQDATLANMWTSVDWIRDIAKAYAGEAKVIFYYAGHGIPDESSRDAFLLPVDGNGTNTRTGYKLSELYAGLNEFPTASTVVLLDACFSGSERSGKMLASARGVAIKAKKEKPSGNMVVLSAASGDETAYPYKEKGHGLFTYYLLKKLQDTNGNVTLSELSDYVRTQVSRQSVVENSKSQTPTVLPSDSLGEAWRDLRL